MLTLNCEETRIKITSPLLRTDLGRKGALGSWQTRVFNLHRSHAQSGIVAGWSLWVFSATGKIFAVSFSIITPIKKIEKSSGFLGTFFSLYYSPLEIDFIYLTLFHSFKILMTHCSFYIYLVGLHTCQKHYFSLPKTADGNAEIRGIESTRFTSSLIIILIQLLLN